ncbi:MAG: hypothetical protein JST19_18340 [Bacteroidetes bacterium]|nr:hypothetical protein [Bacteroidota bacterium]
MTRYILQPYTTPASRLRCPQCNDKRKTFKRYIDTETGRPLADHVGRCDRENSCGYHYKPGQYFGETGSTVHRPWSIAKPKGRIWSIKKKNRPSAMDHGPKNFLCINPDIVNATLRQYRRNNLVQYLVKRFGVELTRKLVCHYYIGTSKHWHGATIFWQMDTLGQVRTGKVMLYDATTGKRVKKPYNHITWAHALLRATADAGSQMSDCASDLRPPTSDVRQCLFGEHLLEKYPDMPVAIVESEKTAIIASGHNRSYLWLACGSISNLSPKMCAILKGRHVTLYPDLGAYDQWLVKARLLQIKIPRTVFNVSDILERNASEADRERGLDVGDFL